MTKNKMDAPIVKWAGGKRHLLNKIVPLLPKQIDSYCEPFLGSGALIFSIWPSKAIVNDLNGDLMVVYETIRDNLESLLEDLKKHENTAEYFYTLRNMDRDKDTYQSMTKVERASRLLYLNKTCFNGLYRVNSSGEFNSPFGRYKNPNIVNELVLRDVSKYFASNSIVFYNEDFSETLKRVHEDSFVYLDPPYDPISFTASFTAYNKGGFTKSDQIRLKQCCDALTRKGVKFMLSNSATDFIKDLYKDYDITIVKAKRSINSDVHKRGAIEEFLIRNYSSE